MSIDAADDRPPRVAYQNGQWIEASRLALSVRDFAVTHAATAVERVRLYHGRLFQVDRHLDRWQRSTETLMIDGLPSRADLQTLLELVVSKNRAWIEQHRQCGLVMFASPGVLPGDPNADPTLVIDLYPIDSELSQSRRESGSDLVITSVQQQPNESWPRDIKVRSRLHYYLADRLARRTIPDALGVLVDSDGTITDTSVANVVIVEGVGLISPQPRQVLPGITMQVVHEIAKTKNLTWTHARITPERFRAADEVLLTGTTDGIWFAGSIDGRTNKPAGPIYKQLRSAFDSLIYP